MCGGDQSSLASDQYVTPKNLKPVPKDQAARGPLGNCYPWHPQAWATQSQASANWTWRNGMTLDGCSMMSFNFFLAEQPNLENPKKTIAVQRSIRGEGSQKIFGRKNRFPIHLGISSGKLMVLPSQKMACFPGILTSGYWLCYGHKWLCCFYRDPRVFDFLDILKIPP